MSGLRAQLTREHLGLTCADLAALIIPPATSDDVRDWEAGVRPLPATVGLEIERLRAETEEAVDDLVRDLFADEEPGVDVWRDDAAWRAATGSVWPARWWRHVVARALERAAGVTVREH